MDHVLEKHEINLRVMREENMVDEFTTFLKDLTNNKVGPYECLYCDYGTQKRRKSYYF